MRLCPLLLLLTTLATAATLHPTGFDATAVQAVLARAKPGDTVALPVGDYLLTAPLAPPHGIRLTGADRERCRLLWRGKPGDVLINVTGCEDVELDHLTLDGELSGTLGQGIAGSNARRLRLHHLTVRNLAKTGGWGPHGILFSGTNPTCAGGVTDSEISDCRFDTIGVGAEYGGGIRLAWGSNRNRVLRNTVHTTGRGGIFGDHSTELTVCGNTVTDSRGEGLALELWGGCARSVVEDNHLDHWLSLDGATLSAVRRNVVEAQDGSTKFLGIEIIASQVVVTDNVVGTGQAIGLSVSNRPVKNDVLWAGNTVRDQYQWGAQLQGEQGGIARHVFYKCRFEGMRRGDPQAMYPQDSGHGFRTNGDCRDLAFFDCAFVHNGGYGLQLGGPRVDRISLTRCEIRGNKGPAFSGGTAAFEFDGLAVGNGSEKLPDAHPFGTAPTLAVTWPEAVKVGQPARFALAGEREHILWDLGDGLPETAAAPTHVYPQPGEYHVVLMAWSRDGRAGVAERRLTVTE